MRGGPDPERTDFPDKAFERMGKTKAAQNRSDQFPWEKLLPMGTLRMRAGDVPMELSFFAYHGAPDRRSGGRQLLCRKALGLFPQDFRRHQGPDSGCLPCGICNGSGGRPNREQRASGRTVRLYLLYRRRDRRQAGNGKSCRPSDSRDSGAGRQEPLHRGQDSRPEAGSLKNRLRQILKLRADLRSSRLPAHR